MCIYSEADWHFAIATSFVHVPVVPVQSIPESNYYLFPESIAKGSSGKSLEHSHFYTYT